MKPGSIVYLILFAMSVFACENRMRHEATHKAEASAAAANVALDSSLDEAVPRVDTAPPADSNRSDLEILLDRYAALSPFEAEMSEISTLRDSIFGLITASDVDYVFAHADHPELTITAAPDSAVFAVSLNQKTGGSLNPYETHIAFRSDSGASYFPAGDALPGAIHAVDSALYLMTDYLQFCGTCIAARALTFRSDTTAFDPKVIFEYSGRTFDFEMRYDPARRELRAEYTDPEYDDGMFAHEGDRFKHLKMFRYVRGRFILFDDDEIEVEQEPFDFGACGA